MTMHINLSSEMENFIKRKVATGFYGNATEVIKDAIRRMQAEENRMATWQSAIKLRRCQHHQSTFFTTKTDFHSACQDVKDIGPSSEMTSAAQL